jgi:hypothetical protein
MLFLGVVVVGGQSGENDAAILAFDVGVTEMPEAFENVNKSIWLLQTFIKNQKDLPRFYLPKT